MLSHMYVYSMLCIDTDVFARSGAMMRRRQHIFFSYSKSFVEESLPSYCPLSMYPLMLSLFDLPVEVGMAELSAIFLLCSIYTQIIGMKYLNVSNSYG